MINLWLRRRLGSVCLAMVGVLVFGARLAADSPAVNVTEERHPIRVIFDTDIGHDVDDALSLAIIHALMDRGELDLLAVTSSNVRPIVARYVRRINAYYGHSSIPVGLADPPANDGDNYMRKTLAQLQKGTASDVSDSENIESAVSVLRRALADAPDGSVVIFMTGFATNLPRLLDSPADAISPFSGRELVLRKVDHLVTVGGAFTDEFKTLCENNLRFDLSAGRRLAEEWPTPIIWSGYEIGKRLILGPNFFDVAFRGRPNSPIDASYRAYGNPYLALWDLVPPLLTARPDSYFRLSQPGRVTVREDGTSFFTEEIGGRDQILLLPTEDEAQRITEAFRWLISEPSDANMEDE